MIFLRFTDACEDDVLIALADVREVRQASGAGAATIHMRGGAAYLLPCTMRGLMSALRTAAASTDAITILEL